MPERGCVLAFDFGEKRIGVAVGDWETRIAHALGTLKSEARAERFARIAALIGEWQPVGLVVGLPFSLDGGEHAMTERCRRFARQLKGRFGLPVALVDERLTSLAAEARLKAAGMRPRARKAVLDGVAAQEILQSYFDAYAEDRSNHGFARPE